MKSKIIWLKVLFVLWILTGILWVGFALPKAEMNKLKVHNTTPNSTQWVSYYESKVQIPTTIVSKPDESTILITKEHKASIKQLSQFIDTSNTELTITGYYTSNELPSIGHGRAQQFKRELIKHHSINGNLVTKSEKRDNLESDTEYIYDVIGIKLKKKAVLNTDLSSINISFNHSEIRLSDQKQTIKSLVKLKEAIEIDKRKMVYLKLYCHKPFDKIVENKNIIASLKEEMIALGFPPFKIVGDILESKKMDAKYYLEIELK